MKITESIFYTDPQQIILNHTVAKGIHMVENIDFCDSMIGHYESLLRQAQDESHIVLFAKYVADPYEYRDWLILCYKRDILRNRSNLINLLFSEN